MQHGDFVRPPIRPPMSISALASDTTPDVHVVVA